MDPLAVLPLEIVEMVLRRLAFREVLYVVVCSDSLFLEEGLMARR